MWISLPQDGCTYGFLSFTNLVCMMGKCSFWKFETENCMNKIPTMSASQIPCLIPRLVLKPRKQTLPKDNGSKAETYERAELDRKKEEERSKRSGVFCSVKTSESGDRLTSHPKRILPTHQTNGNEQLKKGSGTPKLSQCDRAAPRRLPSPTQPNTDKSNSESNNDDAQNNCTVHKPTESKTDKKRTLSQSPKPQSNVGTVQKSVDDSGFDEDISEVLSRSLGPDWPSTHEICVIDHRPDNGKSQDILSFRIVVVKQLSLVKRYRGNQSKLSVGSSPKKSQIPVLKRSETVSQSQVKYTSCKLGENGATVNSERGDVPIKQHTPAKPFTDHGVKNTIEANSQVKQDPGSGMTALDHKDQRGHSVRKADIVKEKKQKEADLSSGSFLGAIDLAQVYALGDSSKEEQRQQYEAYATSDDHNSVLSDTVREHDTDTGVSTTARACTLRTHQTFTLSSSYLSYFKKRKKNKNKKQKKTKKKKKPKKKTWFNYLSK